MKTSTIIDEVGRLLLPRKIRNAIGVFGRTSVFVEVVDRTLRITVPEPSETLLKRVGKRMVYAGPLPKNWHSGEAVLKTRGTRLRR